MSHPVCFDVKVVAFDLDGTLVDTLPDLHTATNLTLNDLGYGVVSRDIVRRYIGQGIEYLLKELFRSLEINTGKEAFVKLAAQFRSHYAVHVCDESVLFPEMLEVLQSLQEKGMGIACLTNKSEEFTLPILDRLAVRHYFQEVICGDTLARRKPDPMPIFELARRFNVEPHEVLMVGDSQTDTACARNAGAPVVCVPYGYRSGMTLADLNGDFVLKSPKDILSCINFA